MEKNCSQSGGGGRTMRLITRSTDQPSNRTMPVHQIKIFKGLEDDTTTIEHDVNNWLSESKVRVIQIIGNVAPQTLATEAVKNTLSRTNHPPSDVMLVVLYEKP
jgi:hypothetical protein